MKKKDIQQLLNRIIYVLGIIFFILIVFLCLLCLFYLITGDVPLKPVLKTFNMISFFLTENIEHPILIFLFTCFFAYLLIWGSWFFKHSSKNMSFYQFISLVVTIVGLIFAFTTFSNQNKQIEKQQESISKQTDSMNFQKNNSNLVIKDDLKIHLKENRSVANLKHKDESTGVDLLFSLKLHPSQGEIFESYVVLPKERNKNQKTMNEAEKKKWSEEQSIKNRIHKLNNNGKYSDITYGMRAMTPDRIVSEAVDFYLVMLDYNGNISIRYCVFEPQWGTIQNKPYVEVNGEKVAEVNAPFYYFKNPNPKVKVFMSENDLKSKYDYNSKKNPERIYKDYSEVIKGLDEVKNEFK